MEIINIMYIGNFLSEALPDSSQAGKNLVTCWKSKDKRFFTQSRKTTMLKFLLFLLLPVTMPLSSFGQWNGTLLFDGDDDFVELQVGKLPADNITIEIFIKPYSIQSTMPIFDKRTIRQIDLFMCFVGDSILSIHMGELGSFYSRIAFQLQEWMHVAITFDGINVKVYQNGRHIRSFTSHGIMTDDATTLLLGYDPIPPQFHGEMDELRISNVIRYHSYFEIPSSTFEPDSNTVCLWHFDSEEKGITFDSSQSKMESILHGAVIKSKAIKY